VVDHEATIRGTFKQLERWRERERHEYTPTEGSELAVDDEDWPWWRLSQLAFAGLASARQHLDAVRVHYAETGPYPLADPTLMRSALLGAAQAAWLLAPDERAVRTSRARTLAAEMYLRHGQYLEELSALRDGADPNTEKVKKRVHERAEELDAKRASDGQRAQLNATSVIETAVGECLGPRLVREGRAMWRAGSGAAHGLVWPVLGRSGTQQTAPADFHGMAPFVAAGSWADIANPYMAAFHLLDHGWRLLDARGGTSGIHR
jgi:hypothetical protein